MKKLLIILLVTLSLSKGVNAQVNEAVDQRVKPIVVSEVKKEVETSLGQIAWDTVYVKQITRAGNIDTLTAPGIYQLSVTGGASAVRIVYVSRSAAGTYAIRTSNPLAWSGTGTWSTAVSNGRVIVSTTNNNILYQRIKIQ